MKSNLLVGKCIVVAVTGGIAAYKTCEIVSLLKKRGANVKVVMTENATRFVSPLTFETLSDNPVITNTFSRPKTWEVEHIALAKQADLFLIAPCTANVIGKIASGIADDFLTTTVMACKCPVVIAPAMNTAMYQNPIVQRNCNTLKELGYYFINPASGFLACGDIGQGRLPEPSSIVEYVCNLLFLSMDLKDKRILITAGATSEPIDAVRFITNRSSGKMGYGLAKAAIERGASVTVILGQVKISFDDLKAEIVKVSTTNEMFEAVKKIYGDFDYIIMAAAPGDYRPEKFSKDKLKDDKISLTLVKNPDIAKFVGENKRAGKLIIFCAETKNLKEYAREKLTKKHADMVIANDVTKSGAGFDGDTNIVSVITKDTEEDIPLTDKYILSGMILDRILNL